jgi:hypothetical protein
MDIVEAPPEHKKRALSEKWLNIVAELKDISPQWGMVGTFSPGTATAIRRGKYAAFLEDMPEGMNPEAWMNEHWEITTRKAQQDSRNDVYIRYLG